MSREGTTQPQDLNHTWELFADSRSHGAGSDGRQQQGQGKHATVSTDS